MNTQDNAERTSLGHAEEIPTEAIASAPTEGAVTELPATTTNEPVLESPETCFDNTRVGKTLLSMIDWNLAESRDQGRGPYKTTKAHSFQLVDEQYRYQFSVSVNRFPKTETGGLTPKEKAAMKTLGLTEAAIMSLRKNAENGQSTDEKAVGRLNSLRR